MQHTLDLPLVQHVLMTVDLEKDIVIMISNVTIVWYVVKVIAMEHNMDQMIIAAPDVRNFTYIIQ